MARTALTLPRTSVDPIKKTVEGVRIANTSLGNLAWYGANNTLPDTHVTTISYWMRMAALPSSSKIMQTDSGRFIFVVESNGRANIRWYDSTPAVSAWLYTSIGDLVLNEWTHVLISLQADINSAHIYVNDADTVGTKNWSSTNKISWEAGTNIRLFYDTDAVYDIAELYINADEYLDISDEYYRRKFISADKKPVNLGPDGSWPTGTAPPIYLSGGADTFLDNLGTMGAPAGAITPFTTSTTSPSD